MADVTSGGNEWDWLWDKLTSSLPGSMGPTNAASFPTAPSYYVGAAETPAPMPANRQQEINTALKALGLQTYGWGAQYAPNLNLSTDDPAITTEYAGVQIGPGAFSGSYGNFLSTLDHEVGAHLTQLQQGTFTGVEPGHTMNEIQAYDLELMHARQNHLSGNEIGGILSTRSDKFNTLDPENQNRVLWGIYTPHS